MPSVASGKYSPGPDMAKFSLASYFWPGIYSFCPVLSWPFFANDAKDSEIFSNKRERDKESAEKLQAKLYQQIGHLKVELDWLKKSIDLLLEEKRLLIEPGSEITVSCWQKCWISITPGQWENYAEKDYDLPSVSRK
jgi:hypothetical protein